MVRALAWRETKSTAREQLLGLSVLGAFFGWGIFAAAAGDVNWASLLASVGGIALAWSAYYVRQLWKASSTIATVGGERERRLSTRAVNAEHEATTARERASGAEQKRNDQISALRVHISVFAVLTDLHVTLAKRNQTLFDRRAGGGFSLVHESSRVQRDCNRVATMLRQGGAKYEALARQIEVSPDEVPGGTFKDMEHLRARVEVRLRLLSTWLRKPPDPL